MIQKITQHWNRFFFEPSSPASLGLFRICFGCVAFLSILGKFPVRNIFYGEKAIVSYDTMSKFYPEGFLWFRWMPGHDPALMLYFLAFLTVIAMLILGFCTRVNSVLLYLGLMSISARNMFSDNSGDDLMRNLSFILMFADAGAVYSVDRWRRVRAGKEGPEPRRVTPWPLRLLQLQLAYLYFDTAYLKLAGGRWRDGTAIYYALNYTELKRFNLKYFFYYLWQIKLMTYGTIVTEFAASTLIWPRKLRYWILLGGAGLHIGINLAMQFPVFQYVMLAALTTFIYPEHVEWLCARCFGPRKTTQFPQPDTAPATP